MGCLGHGVLLHQQEGDGYNPQVLLEQEAYCPYVIQHGCGATMEDVCTTGRNSKNKTTGQCYVLLLSRTVPGPP